MLFSFVFIFLLVLSKSGIVFSTRSFRTVDLPGLTDFGKWGKMDICPLNEYVIGASILLHYDNYVIIGDNGGVGGVKLFCAEPYQTLYEHSYVTSSIYQESGFSWHAIRLCPPNSFVHGLSIRSEEYQGTWRDDVAVSNVYLKCLDWDTGIYFNVEMDGADEGTVLSYKFCDTNYYVCGIKTLIDETTKGFFSDVTALNGISFACCEFDKSLFITTTTKKVTHKSIIFPFTTTLKLTDFLDIRVMATTKQTVRAKSTAALEESPGTDGPNESNDDVMVTQEQTTTASTKTITTTVAQALKATNETTTKKPITKTTTTKKPQPTKPKTSKTN